MSRFILLFVFVTFCSFSYGIESKTICNNAAEKRNPVNFTGNYMDGFKDDGEWWLEVQIRKNGRKGEYNITVHSSKIKSRECCSFNKQGVVRNDTLFVEITDWRHPVTAFITKDEDVITFDVIEKQTDDRLALNWYCCGGASLIGNYKMVPIKTRSKPHKMEIQNTTWSLVDIEQNGSSLPILLDNTLLRFCNGKTFVADFCHKISGSYDLVSANKMVFSVLTKSEKNYCKETSVTPIQTKRPNINVAEDILLFGSFETKIGKDRLILSNKKGKLIFQLFQKQF